MVVHHIETKEEWDKVLSNNTVVLLDCFAEWCGPCKAISPVLEKESGKPEHEGVFFAKIDVDELPELSAELGIRAMPTFMSFVNGVKKDEFVGASVPGLTKLIIAAKA